MSVPQNVIMDLNNVVILVSIKIVLLLKISIFGGYRKGLSSPTPNDYLPSNICHMSCWGSPTPNCYLLWKLYSNICKDKIRNTTVRESLCTQVIGWVQTILDHIDIGASLHMYGGSCMIYKTQMILNCKYCQTPISYLSIKCEFLIVDNWLNRKRKKQ